MSCSVQHIDPDGSERIFCYLLTSLRGRRLKRKDTETKSAAIRLFRDFQARIFPDAILGEFMGRHHFPKSTTNNYG